METKTSNPFLLFVKHFDMIFYVFLSQVSEEYNLQVQPPRENFTSEDDSLILEDTLQRIALAGIIEPKSSYTGSVVALAGHEDKAGCFFVKDFTYAGLPRQVSAPKFEEDR